MRKGSSLGHILFFSFKQMRFTACVHVTMLRRQVILYVFQDIL